MINPTNKWNVIFVVDKIPLQKMTLFKRAADRDFAPNFYTGIGGKVEQNESIEGSAYRELEEETKIKNVKLHEFARVIIDSKLRLYYFWGIYKKKILPKSDVGSLEWVSKSKVLEKEIVPTTLCVVEELVRRDFNFNSPFTGLEEESFWDEKKKVRYVTAVEVKEGLL